MKMNLWTIMATLIALPVVLVLAGQLGFLSGQAPTDLGVQAERLKAPSLTRNSVSSQAALHPDHPQLAYAQIDPLPLRGSPQDSMALLQRALATEPGVRIVMSNESYLRATATTQWMGFVDDLEFWLNPTQGVIDVRSASRLGREDFGANRARMERIRSAYLASQAKPVSATDPKAG
ncbi:MAG: DUF1499 domain-containing protein [Hydrogenophaga sp.]|jgi:uncharacterized protein (DUF1499 family)|nr:DUF1499 domain-containing protein [Hydrogenophaga sp.]